MHHRRNKTNNSSPLTFAEFSTYPSLLQMGFLARFLTRLEQPLDTPPLSFRKILKVGFVPTKIPNPPRAFVQ